ncbi:MAG: RNA polymerase sigma factor [Pseudomonadota bacterium]
MTRGEARGESVDSPRPECDKFFTMTGDAAAEQFEFLMRGHIPALYRYAYRWTGDVDQAEDLVQEALTRVFQELPQLLQIERVRPWVARVMYRIFIDNLRRARRSPVIFVGRSGATGAVLEDEDEDNEAAADTWDPAELTDQALDHQRIAGVWPQLHEQHRVVLALYEIEGYSLEEVAAILEVPAGTVKSRLHRARHRLRELLTEGTKSAAPTCNSPETQ